jgi:hypothetical protein
MSLNFETAEPVVAIDTIGIATSAMLVELNISCWTARKLDRSVSDEIDVAKKTKVKAGNYNKYLLAGNPAHDAVIKYAAASRLWSITQTIPWSDSGPRIVTMENLFNGGYKAGLDERKAEFERLVDAFINVYPTFISAAAFQLGDLFDRDEYPSPEIVREKFRFNYAITPIPTTNDFRINIGEQAKAELIQQYEQSFNDRLTSAMKDVWGRLHTCLLHMSERLSDDVDGKRKKFHGTLLTNARELVDLLAKLNIANDPKLEEARRELMRAIENTDIDVLKESDYVRETVKQKVDEIINRFDW